MLTLELKTRKSVITLRNTLRTACEDMGLRLGQSHQKTEYILSKLFNAGNFNEVMAKTHEPIETRTLTPEDIQDLYAIESENKVFHAADLSSQAPRTLLYGYHCEIDNRLGSPRFHVYLDGNGLIHALTYNRNQQTLKHISGKSIPAHELRPSKRAYPSRTDAEFSFLLQPLLDHRVSYTNSCKNIEKSQYYGKILNDLEPVPELHIAAENLVGSLSNHITNHYTNCLNEDKFDETYAMYHPQEVYNYIDPKTAVIRAVGFSFVNKKSLSQSDIEMFKCALQGELLQESINCSVYTDCEEFDRVFTELLGERIEINPQ